MSRKERFERKLRLMVVEDDPGVGYAVSRWLQDHEVRSVLATTTDEAIEMLRDVIFIEATFDGMLVDYSLPDATGVRVIEELRDEFPSMPVAMMTGRDDELIENWTRQWRIPLFKKPLNMELLDGWLAEIRKTA
jgi:DNA-binding response OmpR family regulator